MYYIVPPFRAAIAKDSKAQATLNGLLDETASYTIPLNIVEYPVVTGKQLRELFPRYMIREYTPSVGIDERPEFNKLAIFRELMKERATVKAIACI
jgi:hypothetical protein